MHLRQWTAPRPKILLGLQEAGRNGMRCGRKWLQSYLRGTSVCIAIGGSSISAYEHGTIRSLPFEESSLGRATRAGYSSWLPLHASVQPSIHDLAPETHHPATIRNQRLLQQNRPEAEMWPTSGYGISASNYEEEVKFNSRQSCFQGLWQVALRSHSPRGEEGRYRDERSAGSLLLPCVREACR